MHAFLPNRSRALFFVAVCLWANDAQAQLRHLPVTLSRGQQQLPFRLQLADTNESRTTGLMYRRNLPARGGMLFVFDDAAPRSFWMKDTFIPLDMLFVDATCTVVEIIAEAPPHSTEGRGTRRAVQYVVELAGGTAKRLGIAVGSRLRFNDVPGQRSCPPRP